MQKSPVLVVDDDEGLLLRIKATLISSGLPEPTLVSDSRRVMDLLRSHRFPLVLLDLMMPHLGGMEVLRRIKEEFPELDCVIVSAIDDVATAVQAMSNGASDYLVKPLNSDKLVALVQSNLERYRFRDELWLAFGSNTLGVPLAAGVLYPVLGWTLTPAFAAAAMSLSSVTVITNALRLSRFRP